MRDSRYFGQSAASSYIGSCELRKVLVLTYLPDIRTRTPRSGVKKGTYSYNNRNNNTTDVTLPEESPACVCVLHEGCRAQDRCNRAAYKVERINSGSNNSKVYNNRRYGKSQQQKPPIAAVSCKSRPAPISHGPILCQIPGTISQGTSMV